MTDHDQAAEDDGPLFCEGCDGELDGDGQCPTPGCDTNGAEYYRDDSPGEAGLTAENLATMVDLVNNPPAWLRSTMAEVVKAFPPVHLALARAAGQVRGVTKDRQAAQDQGGYRFRGIDGVLGGVHFPLAEAGILMVPRDLEIEREVWPHWGGGKWTLYRVHLEWEIYGPRGDTIIVTNWGEALDNADKGLGKARSYAQKDLLIRLLTIPTDDPDMDTEATQFETDTPGVGDQGGGGQGRRSRGDGQAAAEPTPADPELVANLQYIIAGLDEERQTKLREAWKKALGPVPPEKLDSRAAKRAMALIKGMVPDHEKVLEQTKMKVEIGDLPDPTIAEQPGQDDGSEGDDTAGEDQAAAEPDTSSSTTVEDDTSTVATSDTSPRDEGDASGGDDDEDPEARAEAKRAERAQRAEVAAALRDFLNSIESTELDRVGAEVGDLNWQTVDKDLRDTYGVNATPDLHIDIRRMALVVGRTAGPEALAELVDDGLLPRHEPEPDEG